MKKNLVPLLGVAFVVATVATGVFYGLFAGKLRSASPARSIVTAARNLERGTVLKPSDVKISAWGGAEMLKGQVTDLEKVTGLTVLESIQENEPVTESRLASRESGAGAALGIPAGMRAVSIHVADATGVAGLLRAGHKVDVQVLSGRGGRNEGAEQLRTILQDAEVFAVSRQPEATPGRAWPAVITLLAGPVEADMLGLADAGASIRLVLRNPLDDGKPPRQRLALAGLFRDTPAAAKLSASRWER